MKLAQKGLGLALGLGLGLGVGCVRATTATPTSHTIAASVEVGTCADPAKDGVVGGHAKLERADRDLDGDGVAEIVTVDRSLCDGDRNCHWNVFAKQADCARYLGTFDAAALEALLELADFFGVGVGCGLWLIGLALGLGLGLGRRLLGERRRSNQEKDVSESLHND